MKIEFDRCLKKNSHLQYYVVVLTKKKLTLFFNELL